MNRTIEVWKDTGMPMIVDIEKMRERKASQSAEEDAKAIADFILGHVRSDSLEIILSHIVYAIQYDHPEYSKENLSSDIIRAICAITSVRTA